MTACTLYTYKYEVVVNNDKLHSSASAFIPGFLILRLSPSVGSTWAPVRVSPREAHLLATCRIGRWTPYRRRAPRMEDTQLREGRRRWAALGPVGIPGSLIIFLPGPFSPAGSIVVSLSLTFLMVNSVWFPLPYEKLLQF